MARKGETRKLVSTAFKLYQEKSSLAKLSVKDRLDYLTQDPMSLPEIPPLLCNTCQECTCNKSPQNFLKDRLLKEALDDKVKFNSKSGRWETHFVANETMDKLPDRAGSHQSKQRFYSVRKRALKLKKWIINLQPK